MKNLNLTLISLAALVAYGAQAGTPSQGDLAYAFAASDGDAQLLERTEMRSTEGAYLPSFMSIDWSLEDIPTVQMNGQTVPQSFVSRPPGSSGSPSSGSSSSSSSGSSSSSSSVSMGSIGHGQPNNSNGYQPSVRFNPVYAPPIHRIIEWPPRPINPWRNVTFVSAHR